jgi:epsilon-lactone hydrolase
MPSLRGQFIKFLMRTKMLQITSTGASVERERQGMEQAAKLAWLPRGTQVKQVTVGGVPAEWVTAEGAAPDRIMVYLHGGSYSAGSPRTHRALVARLSRATGATGVVLDYGLAPERPFPAAVVDTLAAYRWLLQNGTRPEHIVLAGDSAGGGLALAVALALRDGGSPLPAGIVCLSPWTDLAGTGASLKTRAKADPWLNPDGVVPEANRYLAGASPQNPLASPYYGNPRGLPPIFIQVGDDEILLDDATRMAERARAAGVETTLEVWPGMWHVWQAFTPYIPEARQAIERIGAWVRKRLAIS